MIGIVVVSHSRALAEAAVGLAAEMVAEDKRPVIAVAAGLDATTFGTDAVAVSEAIATADSADGVLVLLDLGSAVLSAEMALEFVDPAVVEHVRLTSAPLVEGLVAAVVTASTGASLDAVIAEAERGLVAKQDHLGDAGPVSDDSASAGEADRTVDVVVSNEHGLHARPAARLVGLVNGFDATVTLTDLDTGKGPVDAGSLSMVATLNAQQGHRVRVGASGPQAAEALTAIEQLAATAFGDGPAPPDGSAGDRPSSGAAGGEAAAGGSGLDVAIGPAVLVDSGVDTGGYVAGDNELERLGQALQTAGDQLRELRDTTPEHGDIFVAHLALLGDRKILDAVELSISGGASAPAAWQQAYDDLTTTFEALDDAYQRERAQDVRAVRDRVLRILVGAPEETPADGILVVPELDAATAATIDAARIAGIAVRAAGTTGHGVIVARSAASR